LPTLSKWLVAEVAAVTKVVAVVVIKEAAVGTKVAVVVAEEIRIMVAGAVTKVVAVVVIKEAVEEEIKIINKQKQNHEKKLNRKLPLVSL
jgi:hypothetical protein